MAKLRGPLMSMDARGQFGKMTVYGGWKGLKTARSYVIPANPKSTKQTAQRGKMTAAVEAYKDAEINELDKAAYNIAASLEAKPMSGFNYVTKRHIAAAIAGDSPQIMREFAVSANTGGSITVEVAGDEEVVAGVRYGSTPSSLTQTQAGSWTGTDLTATIGSLTPGNTVYLQFYTEAEGKDIISGIYAVLVAE